MPASSVDTFFACSLMVVLIVSAMVSTTKIVQPYLTDLANMNGVERYRGFAEYLLLGTGSPSNWGRVEDVTPTAFGLASETQPPYALDIDKVSRLNGNNVYSITYQEILAALGTTDVSFNIKIRPLFEVFINLNSNQTNGANTTYNFQITTSKSGSPVLAWLQSYAIVGTYIDSVSSSTDSNGASSADVNLPNSQNGTALLLVLAKAKADSQIVSFNVYSFGHNSEAPEPNGTFLQPSPLNHVLNVSFLDPDVNVSNAYVFTYSYNFNLTQTASGNQTVEYNVPDLLEACPMMLVLNGNNGSTSFAEWTAYPQLSLEIGADFGDLITRSKAVALTHVVSINSALYEFVITCRGVQGYFA